MSFLPALMVALATATAMPAAAQPAAASAPAPAASTPAAAADFTDAEVRRIDREGGRITLRHGEIRNLDMPPMTMVFAVRDRAQLERLKPGDKVRFRAVAEAGGYTVTELLPPP